MWHCRAPNCHNEPHKHQKPHSFRVALCRCSHHEHSDILLFSIEVSMKRWPVLAANRFEWRDTSRIHLNFHYSLVSKLFHTEWTAVSQSWRACFVSSWLLFLLSFVALFFFSLFSVSILQCMNPPLIKPVLLTITSSKWTEWFELKHRLEQLSSESPTIVNDERSFWFLLFFSTPDYAPSICSFWLYSIWCSRVCLGLVALIANFRMQPLNLALNHIWYHSSLSLHFVFDLNGKLVRKLIKFCKFPIYFVQFLYVDGCGSWT